MDVSSGRGTRGEVPVLVLSHNFPPEVNALATRTYEHARAWTAAGGRVCVVAPPPHFPEGRVYAGYDNRLTTETVEGIDLLRVPTYIAANEGFGRRVASYVSYMLSAFRHARRTPVDPGIVVASTPQFFAGLAGWLVSRRLGVPFVLEVRDLWPESIVDVGALRADGVPVRLLERLETALYRAADHVVVVSPAFQAHVEDRGVPPERISVLPNGVDPAWIEAGPDEKGGGELADELGIRQPFVASYLGTIGMAHGLEVMLDAAARCEDPEIAFVVVGAGAEAGRLRAAAAARGMDNFYLVDKQPRERVRRFYAMSDVSVVPLRDLPAFRKVIPSKMFEAMAMRRPIVLGVAGQAARILEEAGAGITVAPEDPVALLSAVRRLKGDPDLARRMGEAGVATVRGAYDRRAIAGRYWSLLQSVAASA